MHDPRSAPIPSQEMVHSLQTDRQPRPQPGTRAGRRWGRACTSAAAALTIASFGHALIPDLGGIMLGLESVAPFVTAGIAVLAALGALAAPRAFAWIVLCCALALSWSARPITLPFSVFHTADATPGSAIIIGSQNLDAGNADTSAIVSGFLSAGADLIVLEELTPAAHELATATIGDTLPFTASAGTVGVWSRFPLANTERLTLGFDWQRAVRTDIDTPAGTWRLYATHIASVRPGDRAARDSMLDHLVAEVRAQQTSEDADGGAPPTPTVVIGDLNAAPDDRALHGLRQTLSDVRPAFGTVPFTWPAALPLTRPDAALVSAELAPRATLTTARAHGSDHRGILLTLAVSRSPAG